MFFYFDLILLSFFLMASFNISYSVGLMVNYFIFCMPKEAFYYLFWKTFLLAIISRLTVFSFTILKKLLHCLLDSISFGEKSPVILCSSKFIVPLFSALESLLLVLNYLIVMYVGIIFFIFWYLLVFIKPLRYVNLLFPSNLANFQSLFL